MAAPSICDLEEPSHWHGVLPNLAMLPSVLLFSFPASSQTMLPPGFPTVRAVGWELPWHLCRVSHSQGHGVSSPSILNSSGPLLGEPCSGECSQGLSDKSSPPLLVCPGWEVARTSPRGQELCPAQPCFGPSPWSCLHPGPSGSYDHLHQDAFHSTRILSLGGESEASLGMTWGKGH